MNESYQIIPSDSLQQSTQRAGLMAAVKNRMQEYFFQKEAIQQSQIDNQTEYKRPVFMVKGMESTFINMKRSFQYVGDNSTFQKRITWILVFQWIIFSFMVNGIAFFFKTPTFQCKNATGDWESCTQSCPIDNQNSRIKISNSQQSISAEFQLYCDKTHLAAWAQSAFFFGGFISGYLFSYISEKIGRRPNLIFILLTLTLSIIWCAFSPNFNSFVIGYFFIGFCLFGYETSIYIYIGEISANRFRTISNNMLLMTWAGAPIFLPFLSMIPTWRYAFLVFAGILVLTIPFTYNCFLESPRFLVSKKRYEEARKIFQKISITNRRPPYRFKLVQQIEAENQTYLTYTGNLQPPIDFIVKRLFSDQTKSYNLLDLFHYSSLKKPTLVLMYWWLFRFFMYYGLNLALESVLRDDNLLTITIAAAAALQAFGSFGITIMTFFCRNQYKIDIMRIALIIITICCFLLWFLEIGPDCGLNTSTNTNTGSSTVQNKKMCTTLILMLILVAIIKLFNTTFFSGLIQYNTEVFPTPVRSVGSGFTLTFGRLGTIIVPFYINYMKGSSSKNPLCYLTPFGFLAILLCYIMPKTQIQGMRQKIKEEQDENGVELIQI